RQIADIVLVELDSELLVERPSVESGDLTVDLVHQRGGHAVIDDGVEADLGQRVVQLGSGAIERPGLAREIRPEVDDRGRGDIGHDFSWHPPDFDGFGVRIAPLNALSNRKSPSARSENDRRRTPCGPRRRRCRSRTGFELNDRSASAAGPDLLPRADLRLPELASAIAGL